MTFPSKGLHWVDAVRRCLQVALVPLTRDFNSYSCADVRSFAFKSHASCYLNPNVGAPSICDLPSLDYLEIFWTMKGPTVTAFSEALFGMEQVAMGCASGLRHQLGAYEQQIRIRLKTSFPRNKRDVVLALQGDQISTGLSVRRARTAARNPRTEQLTSSERS